jgi:SNF2-related domain/Helicase conserved C-terminal domain
MNDNEGVKNPPLLEAALRAMESVNQDRASLQNDIGYNGTDTRFGQSLFAWIADGKRLSEKQARAGVKMLGKYRNTQLPVFGIDYDLMLKEVDEWAWPSTLKSEERAQHYFEVVNDVTIRLESPYFRTDLVKAIKALPPGMKRWDPAKKEWTFATDPITLAAVRTISETLDIPIRGLEVFEAAQTDALRRIDASRAVDTEFDLDAPEGHEFFRFQVAGIKHLIDIMPRFNGYLGDEMGLGKTIQALGYLRATRKLPALIIVPNVAKLGWVAHVKAWMPEAKVRVLNGGKVRPEAIRFADVVILNYDILAKWRDALMAREWAVLICDEAHYIKNKAARRTQAVVGHKPKSGPYVPGLKDVAAEKLLLSGTATLNRATELIEQLKVLGWIGKDRPMGTVSQFLANYGGSPNSWGAWDGIVPAEKLNELNLRMRALGYIRREKRDYTLPDGTVVPGVLPDLPPILPAAVPLEMDNREEYDRILADLRVHFEIMADKDREFLAMLATLDPSERERARRAYISDRERRALKAKRLVLYEALKQAAARGKLASAIAWIEDFLESSETKKLIVFGHHEEINRALADRFQAPYIIGGMKAEDRLAAEVRFQNDPSARVIVLSIMAASVSLTLTAASDVAFIEYPWRPGDIEQAIGRAYGRVNDPHGVLAWYLVAAETVDESIAKLLDLKRVITTATNRGAAEESEGIMDLLQKALGGTVLSDDELGQASQPDASS